MLRRLRALLRKEKPDPHSPSREDTETPAMYANESCNASCHASDYEVRARRHERQCVRVCVCVVGMRAAGVTPQKRRMDTKSPATESAIDTPKRSTTYCNTLQHTATHCNTQKTHPYTHA